MPAFSYPEACVSTETTASASRSILMRPKSSYSKAMIRFALYRLSVLRGFLIRIVMLYWST